MAEIEGHERRLQKRVRFIQEIEVVGLGVHRCSDISIGGMYLETVHHFPLGNLLHLRFKLHDADERPIQIKARVLYIHEGVGIGLGFVDLNPEDQEKIVKFVEQG